MGKYLKNILIAGGLGYLGGRMAKYFSDNGYNVLITTRRDEKNFPKNIPINAQVIHVDYMLDEQLNKAMKGIDTLIHLAGPDAHTNFEEPDILIKRHVGLTRRLFLSAQRNNVKHFIYFSTIHVYGRSLKGTITEATRPIPVHPFAEAHLEAENIIKSQSKEIITTIVRCSNSFGTPYFENEKCWKLLVNDLCKSAFQNGRLIINSSGQGYRNFIAVEDVVRALHHLMKLNNKKEIHNIYNLGSSHTVRIIDIAKKIQKELKDNFDYDYPIEIIKTSIESNNVGSFIFSTKKMEELGFIPDYSGKEIRSLLEQCKMEQQLVVH
jgi:UDP-glucose 4-epimerase